MRTARLTLRLPENLHERLVARSGACGKSLNQTIVDCLYEVVLFPRAQPLTEAERLRLALADITIPADELFPDEPLDDRDPPLTHETLVRLMPVLDPPLSQTVIEDREDRV
jgi:hypothetical protein